MRAVAKNFPFFIDPYNGWPMTHDYSQTPFSDVAQPFGFADEFLENPEPRCACVLLLDTSGSMQGRPIAELNAGLQSFKEALMSDNLAMKRVEVSVVTFGPVQVHNTFQTPDVFQPMALHAGGDTPMGAGITEAIRLIEERKKTYQAAGVAHYRPWIFLITDGGPTDAWQSAAEAVKRGVEQKKFAFFAVAVEGADLAKLSQISPRSPLQLKGLHFRELFQWLSNSLSVVSRSTTSQEILALPPPSSDWSSL